MGVTFLWYYTRLVCKVRASRVVVDPSHSVSPEELAYHECQTVNPTTYQILDTVLRYERTFCDNGGDVCEKTNPRAANDANVVIITATDALTKRRLVPSHNLKTTPIEGADRGSPHFSVWRHLTFRRFEQIEFCWEEIKSHTVEHNVTYTTRV